MDLRAKIDELWKEHEAKAAQRKSLNDEMVEIRKKINKYKTVLRHAEEIESLPEEKEKV